jgi:hypothetical protein
MSQTEVVIIVVGFVIILHVAYACDVLRDIRSELRKRNSN